ncbi:MAG: hypothetical protein FJX75_07805 [Armatimonadetes bacterium]|nr:hypothetical protein [Armatimonadota bacterium]
MTVPKAYRPTTDIAEAYNRCNPNEPLRGDELKYWYVDCSKVRGAEGLQRRLVERVSLPEGYRKGAAGADYGRALLAGHQGCGKSTELQQVKLQLENAGHWPLVIEAHTEVTPDNLDTEAVVSIVLKGLVEQLSARGVQLNQQRLQDIARWFGEERSEFKDVKEAGLEASVEAGVKGNVLVAMLGAMFRAYIRRGESEVRTATVQHQRYLSDLVDNLSDVLADAHLRVRKTAGAETQLVLLIDGLDRIKHDRLQTEVFITNRELLNRVAAHMVLTVPIDLVCSARSRTVEDTFGIVERMPSLDVESPAGCAKATEIITRRCDESLFESGVLDFICRASGGDVRHIFILAREAILRSRPRPPVTMEGARRACLDMTRSFGDWLQPAHYDALVKHHLDPEDRAGRIAEEVSGQLLLNSALLCYSNGQRCYRVHPTICGMPDCDMPALPAFESRLPERAEASDDG